MNIFWLDDDPLEAAQQHCDQHVVKMIVEYAQMLSTAHRMVDGNLEIGLRGKPWGRQRKHKRWNLPDNQVLNKKLYLATHVNHPSNIWVRESRGNYKWMYDCFEHLSLIFHDTSNKDHGTYRRLGEILRRPPEKLVGDHITPIPKCMPDEFIVDCPIESYREFYLKDKSKFATFKRNGVPEWWVT